MNQENNKRLPRSHYTLLETSREMKTTNTKILAQYLNRSPATIRTQFQRIMAFLEVHCRYEALRKAEEIGLIRKKRRLVSAQNVEGSSMHP
ncbi:DNA-binding response regulator [Nitrosomonas sp.]|uniref:DNA-binding response regulator n=1 Tax=Nitrosomonas sp. TaxID=42353 RepID=UPI0025E2FF3B|nr:DNA-binding response regulator [Nitrosomonas sp.]